MDTSTPLFRVEGVEQLDTELFLRSAPSFLVWMLRLLFLKDVVNRYYDFRLVAIDLVANFYKEQRPDLIPDAIGAVNRFFAGEAADLGVQPIDEQEVRSYYREDALIWSLYLSMRKVDRFHPHGGCCAASIRTSLPEQIKQVTVRPGVIRHVTHRSGSRKDKIVERFARHVSSGKAEFFSQVGVDFVFGRREGVYVWDVDGERRLIDCHCNGGVFNLGHRHPRVIAALQAALDELDIGNHHFISEHRALLAERLTALCPGDLKRVVFGVSGGEAVDTGHQAGARRTPRRPKVISAHGGYHGHTGLALAAGDEQYRKPFEPLPPGFVQVPFGDLDALEAAMDDETAAVIFETIPATMGIVLPPEDFFAGVRQLVRPPRRR